MRKWTLSIRSFFLVCLLLLFSGLYVFERVRGDRLRERLDFAAASLRVEIEEQRSEVFRRQHAYSNSLDIFELIFDVNIAISGWPRNVDAKSQMKPELERLLNKKSRLDEARQKLFIMQQELFKVAS